MKNPIGVMQGRLLPKYLGRYQAHPVGYWEDEFPIAQSLNLDCIEFILDYNDAQKNPLLRDNGVDEIMKVVEQTGVTVKTVCADYFMEAPLHSEDDTVAANSLTVLHHLLDVSVKIGISDIVIPCVDQSSLNASKGIDRFVASIRTVLDDLERKNINLSLETDLAPSPFENLLNKFDSSRITVNYDIGNSAALGYDPIEELDAYGKKITDIHIKDRLRNGGPVILGQGNANFELSFNKLKELDYCGPFIMQAYRDEEGVDIFKKQIVWIKTFIEKL